jgi:hypothetical protein
MGKVGMIRTAGWTSLVLALLAALLASQPSGDSSQAYYDANLLINPSMESFATPYGSYPADGRPLQVAVGWERFWHVGSGWTEPFWMDARVFGAGGWVERIDGETSQSLFSGQPFDGGIYQQVSGVTPGRGYGFNAPVASLFRTTAPPQEPVHGVIHKRVGLDPTGGTNPDAATVIWSEPDGTDRTWRIHLRTAAFAEASTVTVFVRVTNLQAAGSSYLNQSWMDSAILAQTPYVEAASPLTTTASTFTVSWVGAQPAPGGSIRKYDVQFLDEAEGVWHDWQTDTTATSATFTGQMGHIYHFRARAWQAYNSGAWLFSPYRAQGDTETWVGAVRVAGRVRDIWDKPIGSATVAIAGTPYATSSRADGAYQLYAPALNGPRSVQVGHPIFGPVPPVLNVDLSSGADVGLDFVLPPLSDAVVNGGFEAGLSGWQVAGGTGLTVEAHTGAAALRASSLSSGGQAVSRPAAADLPVVATTTFPIEGLVEPALSLWYAPQEVDPDGRLELWYDLVTEAEGASMPLATTRVFVPNLDVQGWHHTWWALSGPGEVLTGTVVLRVALHGASVALDEVVLGGLDRPRKTYLPVVWHP